MPSRIFEDKPLPKYILKLETKYNHADPNQHYQQTIKDTSTPQEVHSAC
jgi:hypothetical protein